MSSTRDAVIELVREYAGRNKLPADDEDLLVAGDIEGDDAFDFMHAFFTRFDVSLEEYRWYFHHAEEGGNFGALFVRPPNARVERIPITVKILVNAAETKKWPLVYPPHEFPKRRWDLRINQAFGVSLLTIAALVLWRCGSQ